MNGRENVSWFQYTFLLNNVPNIVNKWIMFVLITIVVKVRKDQKGQVFTAITLDKIITVVRILHICFFAVSKLNC